MAGSKDKQAEPTKRPRLAPTDQAMASAPRPRRAMQPLTMTELTRGFLAHEDELQTILHQLSMVHKLPADGPLAVALLEAVQGWLQVHRPGRAHPSGSISSVVAGVLFPYLLNSKRPGEITEAEWDGLHSSYPCAHVQRGPSCRLRSRDSAVLGTRRGQEGCSPPRIAPEAP